MSGWEEPSPILQIGKIRFRFASSLWLGFPDKRHATVVLTTLWAWDPCN